MRTKTLALLAILATSTMLLAWCNNTNNESEVVEPEEEVLNEAWQYCVDNWWSHKIVTSETAVHYLMELFVKNGNTLTENVQQM